MSENEKTAGEQLAEIAARIPEASAAYLVGVARGMERVLEERGEVVKDDADNALCPLSGVCCHQSALSLVLHQAPKCLRLNSAGGTSSANLHPARAWNNLSCFFA